MKAVLCKVYGPPESLVIEDIEAPRPRKGQVVVAVKACGVNFPDTLIIQGKYQFKPPMPFVPGGEVAGIVKEVGEEVDTVKVGDRVIGFTSWGGFAEEVVVDAQALIPIPDAMDFNTAAAFEMTYGTAHYALKDRGQLQAGETLLVLGAAGGVGLAAVQIGKAMGARVIAAASTDAKLEACRQQGADEVINYATEDLKTRVKDLSAGNGVDVILDPVGLVVGFTAGEIPRIPLNLTLLKSCSIVGVFWGPFTMREPKRNREYIQELLTWYEEGKIRPVVSATYPLEQVADALNDMMNRRVTGKVVLLP